MFDGYLIHTKRLALEFCKYYLASVLVLGINGELFNMALRVWSNNQMSFYNDGLWQINLILSFFLTCCVMFSKYCPE
ncbi:hypothetical protein J4N42_15665 [Vibrio sp. SCSIO 43135]|uniref:Uncharacterized protein n=1 Tax=Vibrio paucivorans TaxID=2829489 RepID=A0A9X3CFL1_9VIBR|nr:MULTISPECIES: hypothetical protein [Vibrio]MCW8334574.1 hypothetical protein [Vibrio paucivorans]USD43613.1 hypothetical protein J4N42_15665 [Vibrio sp. SCSIO 43135]